MEQITWPENCKIFLFISISFSFEMNVNKMQSLSHSFFDIFVERDKKQNEDTRSFYNFNKIKSYEDFKICKPIRRQLMFFFEITKIKWNRNSSIHDTILFLKQQNIVCSSTLSDYQWPWLERATWRSTLTFHYCLMCYSNNKTAG